MSQATRLVSSKTRDLANESEGGGRRGGERKWVSMKERMAGDWVMVNCFSSSFGLSDSEL